MFWLNTIIRLIGALALATLACAAVIGIPAVLMASLGVEAGLFVTLLIGIVIYKILSQ